MNCFGVFCLSVAAAGVRARRGAALRVRCAAGGRPLALSAKLHKGRGAALRGRHDLLEQFRAHRVSGVKRNRTAPCLTVT